MRRRFDREERLRKIRRRRFRLYWLGCPVRSFSVYKIYIRMGLFRRFLENQYSIKLDDAFIVRKIAVAVSRDTL